jgi:hypothetical protein
MEDGGKRMVVVLVVDGGWWMVDWRTNFPFLISPVPSSLIPSITNPAAPVKYIHCPIIINNTHDQTRRRRES